MRNNKPAPFNMINALSFHRNDTINQRNIPTIDNCRSSNANSSTPRMDIAPNTKNDAIHLIYQSRVYLGVADLNILFDFSSSCRFILFFGFFPFTKDFIPPISVGFVVTISSFASFSAMPFPYHFSKFTPRVLNVPLALLSL